MTTYNVYCDESAHLPHDRQPVMALGATRCPLSETRRISDELRALKKRHGLPPNFEIKWTKVSPSKIDFYEELVDYFFDTDDLTFRALLIPEKSLLDHDRFEQDHDTWYYKMYYSMLQAIISPKDRFRIYLDIKDTRSADKIRKLHEVLCNKAHDFDQSIIERVQTVRSHEVEILQLTDLLMGAVRYANIAQKKSRAKNQMVERLRIRSGYSLKLSTLLREDKFNLFFWRPREVGR